MIALLLMPALLVAALLFQMSKMVHPHQSLLSKVRNVF